jgi:hypothetical protein
MGECTADRASLTHFRVISEASRCLFSVCLCQFICFQLYSPLYVLYFKAWWSSWSTFMFKQPMTVDTKGSRVELLPCQMLSKYIGMCFMHGVPIRDEQLIIFLLPQDSSKQVPRVDRRRRAYFTPATDLKLGSF